MQLGLEAQLEVEVDTLVSYKDKEESREGEATS
jgi:hypothetical protein